MARARVFSGLAFLILSLNPWWISGTANAVDGPSPTQMNGASKAVVQVIARTCRDTGRTGSGFLWDTRTQVVTALHVIAGCSNIVVYFSGNGEIPARIARTLPKADLALLEVDPQSDATPLQMSATTPQVNDTLEVIGYYFGVPSLDSRPLRLTLGSPILREMLTDSARRLLQTAGSPSLSTEILRLDGNLLPGLSGAPVIDATGGVVGIGSGGLENGTVGVSWAIQAHYLVDLKNAAGVSGAAISPQAPVLFSAPAEGTTEAGVRCGDFEFLHLKTRTLKQLMETADDVPGLVQLAATSGMSNLELQDIEFDIYADKNSGGSVALPKGASLTEDGAACGAKIVDGLDVSIASSRVSNQLEVQDKSVAFENSFDAHGLVWRPDLSFTYVSPMTRADGLVVRRKNFMGFAPPGLGFPVADTFETLMSRGNVFIGVRATNTSYNPQLFQSCRLNPGATGCGDVNEFFANWVATALSIQMSTFPPN